MGEFLWDLILIGLLISGFCVVIVANVNAQNSSLEDDFWKQIDPFDLSEK